MFAQEGVSLGSSVTAIIAPPDFLAPMTQAVDGKNT
jgi:hypothetical protein